jgi:acyl carrier protein
MNRITPETMIFLEGIFDSMGFILLIDFLENNLNIKANEDDLIEKNFESVKAITDFVIRKRNGFPYDIKYGITID